MTTTTLKERDRVTIWGRDQGGAEVLRVAPNGVWVLVWRGIDEYGKSKHIRGKLKLCKERYPAKALQLKA